MNKDELINLIGPAVALLAPFAAKYGLSASDLTAFLTGVVGIGIAAATHWNMKKAPETATVIPASK